MLSANGSIANTRRQAAYERNSVERQTTITNDYDSSFNSKKSMGSQVVRQSATKDALDIEMERH